jgi:predicted ABC-type transport system involved in lysophospholipase L1 biosynthesis ATPase subunit
MPPVVKIEEIHKIYDSGEIPVHAVRGVTLEIQRGDFVALMGASGSGKSTLMNLLGCLDRPTRGRYLLDGIDVSQLDRNALADIRNQKLGFVFQGFNLLARTTIVVTSNLGSGSSHSNKDLPVLLAGGRFQHGQHLAVAPGTVPLSNLYLSVLHQLGMDDKSFGASTGTLKGLELA